jgi:hypothetical protein
MSSFLTATCAALGTYLVAVIACAGLSVHIGGLTVGSFKLVNPAMAFLALLCVRALSRRGDPGDEPAAGDPARDARLLRIAWIGLAVPLAVMAWGRALDGGFIREDFHRLERVLAGQPLDGATWRDAGINTYWSRQVSLALDAVTLPAFGLVPEGWHALNLAIHLLVALLAGRLLLALGGSRAAAVLATMLVAVCPMAVEPVCWIAARDDSLAALFALASALATVASLTGTWSRATWALSLAATLLALFCKESALPLPAVLCVLGWLACGRFARAFAHVIPHAALVVVYVAVRGQMLAAQGWQPGKTFCDWGKMALLPLSPLGPLAFPINMHVFGELAPYARLIVGLALVGAAVVALARRRTLVEPRTVALYAALLLFTVPVYRMIHLSATLQNNRYLYLPGVFFAMLLAHVLTRNAGLWGGRARLAAPLLVGACCALARLNAEPWVAAGAVANRLRMDLAPLVAELARHESVRLDGLPDQYRGAFLFNLSDATGPLVVFHGLPPAHRFRLAELYHADSKPRARRAGEPELRWTAGQGLVSVPENTVSTRSRSAASVIARLASGTSIMR